MNYTEKELISYQFGLEIRKAGEKMKADTYGFVDKFIINDKHGINLEYSLRHISNRLQYFSLEFLEKLKVWYKRNGRYSIDKRKFTIGLLGGPLP